MQTNGKSKLASKRKSLNKQQMEELSLWVFSSLLAGGSHDEAKNETRKSSASREGNFLTNRR